MCDILCFVVVVGGCGGRMGFSEDILCTFFLRFQECNFKDYIAMCANFTRGVW